MTDYAVGCLLVEAPEIIPSLIARYEQELPGWLGFDQVLHEGVTLTIFARRIG